MNDTFNQGGLNATTFPHWAVWNIPVGRKFLAEDLGLAANSGAGIKQLRYRGSCPPAGQTHIYTFTIYALSQASIAPIKAGGAALSFDNAPGQTVANTQDYAGVRAAITAANANLLGTDVFRATYRR